MVFDVSFSRGLGNVTVKSVSPAAAVKAALGRINLLFRNGMVAELWLEPSQVLEITVRRTR